MRVAIGKIDGVESVEVSLNEGVARIRLQSGNKVRLEQFTRAVEEKGFTPKAARVTVRGTIVVEGDKLQFRVVGTGDSYALSLERKGAPTADQLKEQAGKPIEIDGVVPAPDKKHPSRLLEVTGWEAVLDPAERRP